MLMRRLELVYLWQPETVAKLSHFNPDLSAQDFGQTETYSTITPK